MKANIKLIIMGLVIKISLACLTGEISFILNLGSLMLLLLLVFLLVDKKEVDYGIFSYGITLVISLIVGLGFTKVNNTTEMSTIVNCLILLNSMIAYVIFKKENRGYLFSALFIGLMIGSEFEYLSVGGVIIVIWRYLD